MFNNGVCLQWGRISDNNTQYNDITFPTSFSNSFYVGFCNDKDSKYTINTPADIFFCFCSQYNSTTGTRILYSRKNIGSFYWFVIGN